MSINKIYIILFFIVFDCCEIAAQELYVLNDPASNVPAKSLNVKYGGKFVRESYDGHQHWGTRHMLESSIGLSKSLMIRPSATFSNMYKIYPDRQLNFESMALYAKWRWLSIDDIHKHLRAAVFVKSIYSTNDLLYDELTGEGDQSAFQAGLIFTQLVNKLAVSSTFTWQEVLDSERWLKYSGPRNFGYRSFNYALSAGYLMYPKKYSSYGQTNFNVYLEVIGSNGIDRQFNFLDLAPAIQLIINSSSKLNLGYRFQLAGNAFRMAQTGFNISFEQTFLNAFSDKTND
jgi:hypothetical protein